MPLNTLVVRKSCVPLSCPSASPSYSQAKPKGMKVYAKPRVYQASNMPASVDLDGMPAR